MYTRVEDKQKIHLSTSFIPVAYFISKIQQFELEFFTVRDTKIGMLSR